MNEEIRAYLQLEVTVAAAFNFFINGMIAALIYHKADMVPADALSLAVDLTMTCLLIFTLSAFFCRASLRRTKTAGILYSGSKLLQALSRLFRCPLLFGVLLGCAAAAVLWTLLAPALALFNIKAIPFGLYVIFKSILCTLLGGGATLTELYAGLCRIE